MSGIVLTIDVDDRGSVRVKQFSDETKKAFEEMKKGPDQAKAPLAALSDGWVGLTAKVTLAMGVIYGVSRAIASFVEEAAEAESIEKRLQFAIEGAGYSWAAAKEAVDQFADSVMETTRFSDDQARQAMTDMLMYTNEFSKAETGARLAMDLSIRTGHDLSSSTRLIGMAMSGNVEMLGRYLPQLKNLDAVLGADATMAEKAAYAIKVLQEGFGGTSANDIDTYNGAVGQMKKQWGELKKELGEGLLPTLTKVFGVMTDIIKASREGVKRTAAVAEAGGDWAWAEAWQFKEMMGGGPPKAGAMFTSEEIRKEVTGGKKDTFPEDYSQIIRKSADENAKAWGDYAQAELDALDKMFKDQAEDRIATERYTFEKILSGEQEFAKDYQEAWDAVYKVQNELDMEWVRNHELAQQRILEGEQEMTNTIAEAWAAVHKVQVDQFNEEVRKSDEVVRMISSDVSSAWSTNLTQMIKGAESFSDAVENIFSGMADAVINSISKMLVNFALLGSLTGEKGGTSFFGTSTGGYGGIIGGLLSGIKLFGEGGIVSGPTAGIVGEAGPEAVIPLKDGRIPIEGGGGQNVYITNIISAIDTQSMDEALRKNSDSVLGINQRSARAGGSFRRSVRRY